MQETRSVHDSMNRPTIEFITYIYIFIISQVSIFNFHLAWLVFQIFRLKSDITENLEQPKRQFPALNAMAIRVQRHANVKKKATLLGGVDVDPPKRRVFRCGLNRFVHEGTNDISKSKGLFKLAVDM